MSKSEQKTYLLFKNNLMNAFKFFISPKLFFIYALSLFLSPNSFAAIIQNSVQIGGASKAFQTSTNQWKVYGSFLGPDGGSNPITTIDSCKTSLASEANFVGCNKKRVLGSTILTVTFNDDVQFTGTKNTVAYVKNTSGSSTTYTNVVMTNQVPYNQGATYQAQMKWSDLCTAAGGSSVGSYGAAETILGGSQTAESCLDSGGNPINVTVNLAVGVAADSSSTASSEILINLTITTLEPGFGVLDPDTLSAPIEGSDGFSGVTPCALRDITASDGTTTVTSGSSETGNGVTYDGFCDYQVLPGDEKIKFQSNQGITNTLYIIAPSQSTGGTLTIPYAGFTMYLSNADFTATLPWNHDGSVTNLFNANGNPSSGFKDSSLSSGIIKNDQPVFTRMATLDEAGNITHLFSDAVITANCSPIPADSSDPNYYRFFVGQVLPTDTVPYTGRCPYATVPSLITGLLDEDINCFVATALKGSPYNYQVLALRKFRNHFLKSFKLGRNFIDFYYNHGPKAAKWLNQNPSFKPFFRVLLWPVYIIAEIFNRFGSITGLVFLLLLTTLPWFFFKTKNLKSLIKI